MSTVLGGNGMKEVYMKLASFGAITIDVTIHADNTEIMSVDIGAENRKETVSMQTNKDETIDQFCQRIRSMMRSLWNTEPRVTEADKKAAVKEAAKEDKKDQSWDAQKAAIKSKTETLTADLKK